MSSGAIQNPLALYFRSLGLKFRCGCTPGGNSQGCLMAARRHVKTPESLAKKARLPNGENKHR